MNKRWLCHGEALANTVTGIAIAQGFLWLFGVAFNEALALNAVMFTVSYVRSYIIRMLFDRNCTNTLLRRSDSNG
jgi:hypothetical protein